VAAQGDSDLDASLSLLDTMLGVAYLHARQRNALALLESGLQPLFFTYLRDNNAPLFGPFVCCCLSGVRLTSRATRSKRCSAPSPYRASCRSVLP
jgi:hypothetical protein